MLGHRFAAEAARNRTNRRTYDGAYRASSERASRRTSSNAACRCSKPYSNGVRTRCASNRVTIRPNLSRGVIVHVVLRCTVKEEPTVSGRVGTVCAVPHANEGVTTPVKAKLEVWGVRSARQQSRAHNCTDCRAREWVGCQRSSKPEPE
jgi:hypothetical protein